MQSLVSLYGLLIHLIWCCVFLSSRKFIDSMYKSCSLVGVEVKEVMHTVLAVLLTRREMLFSKWPPTEAKVEWNLGDLCLHPSILNLTICLTTQHAKIDGAKNSANMLEILKLQIPVVAACNRPGWGTFETWKTNILVTVVFSNRATFRLSGHVSWRNVRIWGSNSQQWLKVQGTFLCWMSFVLYPDKKCWGIFYF